MAIKMTYEDALKIHVDYLKNTGMPMMEKMINMLKEAGLENKDWMEALDEIIERPTTKPADVIGGRAIKQKMLGQEPNYEALVSSLDEVNFRRSVEDILAFQKAGVSIDDFFENPEEAGTKVREALARAEAIEITGGPKQRPDLSNMSQEAAQVSTDNPSPDTGHSL